MPDPKQPWWRYLFALGPDGRVPDRRRRRQLLEAGPEIPPLPEAFREFTVEGQGYSREFPAISPEKLTETQRQQRLQAFAQAQAQAKAKAFMTGPEAKASIRHLQNIGALPTPPAAPSVLERAKQGFQLRPSLETLKAVGTLGRALVPEQLGGPPSPFTPEQLRQQAPWEQVLMASIGTPLAGVFPSLQQARAAFTPGALKLGRRTIGTALTKVPLPGAGEAALKVSGIPQVKGAAGIQPKVGEVLQHPQLGKVTVTDISDPALLGIRTESGGIAKVGRETFGVPPAAAPEAAAPAAVTPRTRPRATRPAAPVTKPVPPAARQVEGIRQPQIQPAEAITQQPAREIPKVTPPSEAVTPPIEPSAAQPPVQPPGGRPPTAEIPAGQPPAVPVGPSFPEVERSLRLASEMVKQDRPGIISDILNRIPGIKKLRAIERPGLTMPEHILTSHVAEGSARAEFAQAAFPTRQAILNRIEAAFGRGTIRGGKTQVRFLGTSEQAANPITGTFKDIAENPELYALSDAQKAVLADLEARNTQLLTQATSGYGAEIGQFSPKPGGAFLPNVDISEEILAALERTPTRAVATGRGKTRIWQTARERMAGDPAFKPMTDVRMLLNGMDEFKASAASGNVFNSGIRGKTRLEVLQETHPALARQMQDLRQRLQGLRGTAGRLDEKIQLAVDDFLASPLDDVNLSDLHSALDVKVGLNAVKKAGPNFGKTPAQVNAEIDGVRQQLRRLQPAWKAANLRDYEFVQEGIYRYFPHNEAKVIRELRRQATNPVLNFFEQWRGTAFGGDFSPITGVQTPLGFFFDPIGVGKQWLGGIGRAAKAGDPLRAFRAQALADDIAADVTRWREFAFVMGRATKTATPQEFAGGLLRHIPGYSTVNDAMYVTVMRQGKRLFDDLASGLERGGLTHEQAIVVAGDKVAEVYPLINPRRLGQSPAQAAVWRAIPTSISFLRKPIELTTEAARGYVKMATLGVAKLSPKERLAVRLMTTLAASTATASGISAILTAKDRNEDWQTALLRVINPSSGDFANVILPGNRRIPLGGPYRSFIRALAPQKKEGLPFPIPFTGIPNMLYNKLTPAIRTQAELFRDPAKPDYYTSKIIKGGYPERLLRILAYELEGGAPLTIGQAVEGVRKSRGILELLEESGSQFLGFNLYRRQERGEAGGAPSLRLPSPIKKPVSPLQQPKLQIRQPTQGIPRKSRPSLR